MIASSVIQLHEFTLTYNKQSKGYAYLACCPVRGVRARLITPKPGVLPLSRERGSELGNYSQARGTPLSRERGPSSVITPKPGVLLLSGERGPSSVITPKPGILLLSGERGPSSVITPKPGYSPVRGEGSELG